MCIHPGPREGGAAYNVCHPRRRAGAWGAGAARGGAGGLRRKKTRKKLKGATVSVTHVTPQICPLTHEHKNIIELILESPYLRCR